MPSNTRKNWNVSPRPFLRSIIRKAKVLPQWEPGGVWFKSVRDIPYGEGLDKTLFKNWVILKGNLTKVYNHETKIGYNRGFSL